MADQDDIDLAALSDEELVQQMHEDLYDGLAEEIEEGVHILPTLMHKSLVGMRIFALILAFGAGILRSRISGVGRWPKAISNSISIAPLTIPFTAARSSSG